MEKQIVCTLPEAAQAQRRAEIQTLLQTRTALTRRPDGVELEWTFSEDTAHTLLDFILFERVCCNSFSYQLEFPPPQDTVHLRIKASTEQLEALYALFS